MNNAHNPIESTLLFNPLDASQLNHAITNAHTWEREVDTAYIARKTGYTMQRPRGRTYDSTKGDDNYGYAYNAIHLQRSFYDARY